MNQPPRKRKSKGATPSRQKTGEAPSQPAQPTSGQPEENPEVRKVRQRNSVSDSSIIASTSSGRTTFTTTHPTDESQPRDDAEMSSFSRAAIKLKLLSTGQLQEAAKIRKAYASATAGRKPSMGQILLELGYLDQHDVDKIIAYQEVADIADAIPGFRIARKVGEGAMGIVYKAKQIRLDRWVAIKILQPQLAANDSWRSRFITEARTAAKLNHPNIITGIDAGEANHLCYFAMEYVEGQTLQGILNERGPLDERFAMTIVHQMACALDHALTHGMIHRDIKPDNIMVNREHVAKLLDLGLAKILMHAPSSNQTRGMAVGTPNFISPEQAMGRADVDSRSDIYSLGATLFTLLTGRTPFSGPPEVVMYRHIHEPPPHLKTLRPDITDDTAEICAWMMAKHREDRPQSPRLLAAKVQELLDYFSGRSSGTRSAVRAPAKRNPRSGAHPTQPHPRQPRGQQPPQQQQDAGPRMPRKRKRNFGAGW